MISTDYSKENLTFSENYDIIIIEKVKKGVLKMKIVINRCYGGFGLSDECAVALGAEIKELSSNGFTYHDWGDDRIDEDLRFDSRLIDLMETKGTVWCSGSSAQLKVVEVPDDVSWEITDYDGYERVEECHRVWC